MKTANDVQSMCFKSVTKIIGEGKGEQNEAIKQLTDIVGGEKAGVIKKLFGKSLQK